MDPRILAEQLLSKVPAPASFPKIEAGSYSVSLTVADGEFVLNWSAASVGYWDYVALYAPGGDISDPYGYLTRQWQWASRGTSYQTGTTADPGYVAVYWSWNYAIGKYVSVAQTAPYA